MQRFVIAMNGFAFLLLPVVENRSIVDIQLIAAPGGYIELVGTRALRPVIAGPARREAGRGTASQAAVKINMPVGPRHHRLTLQIDVVEIFPPQPPLPIALRGHEIRGVEGVIPFGKAAVVVNLYAGPLIVAQPFQVADRLERHDPRAAPAAGNRRIGVRPNHRDGLTLPLSSGSR